MRSPSLLLLCGLVTGSPSFAQSPSASPVQSPSPASTSGTLSVKARLVVVPAQIGDELRQGYRLGFTPDVAAAEEGYHRVDLELTGPRARDKLNLQTRDGYYTAGK